MKVIGIACINFNRAIGIKNKLLYNIRSDLTFFKQVTSSTIDINKKNAVLMGTNTYKSIPDKYKPLKNRVNIVISENNYENVKNEQNNVFNSIENGLDFVYSNPDIENLYIIGGESIYNYFYKKNLYDSIVMNEVQYPKNDIGDKFFPKINTDNYMQFNKALIFEMPYIYQRYLFINKRPSFYKKKPTCEINYLNVLEDVFKNGEIRNTRNSKTLSKFGVTMKFNISNTFPLLTTKKLYWKGIVEELLWFLKADTNSKNLEEKNVNIWKANSSTEFLKNNNFKYSEGDCGPIYGHQWRHFNANYNNCNSDYKNQGIDQLQNCIDLIKTDPYSRRIFMTAWNPCQLEEMVLPPCHVSYQFYVTKDGRLNCQMYQRSGDMFLGIPFNIASTALLTNIIATMTDYKPGSINIVVGDAHIYESHIEQVKEQLSRKPYPFPTLEIKHKYNNIEEYSYEDFDLKYYNSHDKIKGDMIV